ncbi:MAG: hypothetical protein AAF772_11720 [Acidobacteriota bacterium]
MDTARRKFQELTDQQAHIKPEGRVIAELRDGIEVQLRVKIDGTGKLEIFSPANRLREKVTFTSAKE